MGGAPAGVKTGAVYPCCIAMGTATTSISELKLIFVLETEQLK